MKKQGYQQGQSDHTMFFRHNKDVKKTILIIYINDIILTKNNLKVIERLKKTSTEFEIKDLEQMLYFLGQKGE